MRYYSASKGILVASSVNIWKSIKIHLDGHKSVDNTQLRDCKPLVQDGHHKRVLNNRDLTASSFTGAE